MIYILVAQAIVDILALKVNLEMPLLLLCCQQQKQTGAMSSRRGKINLPLMPSIYFFITYYAPSVLWLVSHASAPLQTARTS
jgi:hypothetical protein